MTTTDHDTVRNRRTARIDGSERGKLTIKLRTLMTEFGYTTQQYIRQPSLVAVETTLSNWCIAFTYPGDRRPDDWITLSRREVMPETARQASHSAARRTSKGFPATVTRRGSVEDSVTDATSAPSTGSQNANETMRFHNATPLSVLFQVGGLTAGHIV